MPRVNYVKNAAKDYPAAGIKKGDPYYWWKFRYGGKRMSKTRPRQSQLTQSKASGIYEAIEAIEDARDAGTNAAEVWTWDRVEDVINALNDGASSVREIGEEYREGASNQRDFFPDSPTADESDEKADACDTLADAWEQAAQEIQSIYDDHHVNDEAADLTQAILDEILSHVESVELDWSY